MAAVPAPARLAPVAACNNCRRNTRKRLCIAFFSCNAAIRAEDAHGRLRQSQHKDMYRWVLEQNQGRAATLQVFLRVVRQIKIANPTNALMALTQRLLVNAI